MNPVLGSMNPVLGSMNPGHGTIVTEVPLVERSQAVCVGSNPCPMFDRRVLMHRWWLSMVAYQQVTDDLVISPLCLRQTEATPGGWRGEALTASRSARSSYSECVGLRSTPIYRIETRRLFPLAAAFQHLSDGEHVGLSKQCCGSQRRLLFLTLWFIDLGEDKC